MKHIVPFMGVLGVVALLNEFYILGLGLLLVVALLYFLAWSRAVAILNLYDKMPSVWQDIRETVELGQKHGFIMGNYVNTNLYYFYTMMETHEQYFELKIDEQMIRSYQIKYGLPNYPDAPVRMEGLFYFILSTRRYPERLPEIVKAVMIKKSPHGRKERYLDTNHSPAFG